MYFTHSSFFDFQSVIVAVPLSLRNRFTGRPRTSTEFSLNCSNQSTTTSCVGANESSAMACPGFFRWIHEDLRPWKDTGISRDMLERARKHAHFRLVIVEGKAYVEQYSKPYQTRDVFTIWGILQLLNLYPGKIPDLELMFRCGDKTVIQKHDIQGSDAMSPAVLFQYCGHSTALNIVFPDWTFWGWWGFKHAPLFTSLQAPLDNRGREAHGMSTYHARIIPIIEIQ